MQERRRFPRTRITQPLTARTSRSTELRVVDLSVSGLRVVSAHPLRPGQGLRLSLPTGGATLDLTATVRRCRAVRGREGFAGIAYEAGLEFSKLDQATVATIEAAFLTPGAPAHQGEAHPACDHGFPLIRAS